MLKREYAALFALAAITLFSVLLLPFLRTPFPVLSFTGNPASATGTLTADAKQLGRGRHLYQLRLDTLESHTGITVYSDGIVKVIAKGDFMYRGSRVAVSEPELKNFNCHLLFFQPPPLTSAVKVTFLDIPELMAFRAKALEYMIEKISMIDSGDRLATALLTGDRRYLDPGLMDNIKKSGCSHLLALSGMHLGILTVFVFFLVRKIAGIKISIIVSMVFNMIFAFTAGMSAALLRALILFFLASFAKLSNRRSNLKKLIVLCFLLSVLIASDEAGELSFQYSFAAVAGIVFSADYLYKLMLPYLPPVICAPFACTISAQLPSLLLTSFVFGEIAVTGAFSSLILTPLVTLYMLCAFPLFLLVSLAGFAPAPALFLLEILSAAINRGAAVFAAFPSVKTDLFFISILIISNLFVIFSSALPGRMFCLARRYK